MRGRGKSHENRITLRCCFLFTEKKCNDPETPDNAKLTCTDLGMYKYCQITCNPGKQLFKYTFGSTCMSSTLVWEPEEIPDCVGWYGLE